MVKKFLIIILLIVLNINCNDSEIDDSLDNSVIEDTENDIFEYFFKNFDIILNKTFVIYKNIRANSLYSKILFYVIIFYLFKNIILFPFWFLFRSKDKLSNEVKVIVSKLNLKLEELNKKNIKTENNNNKTNTTAIPENELKKIRESITNLKDLVDQNKIESDKFQDEIIDLYEILYKKIDANKKDNFNNLDDLTINDNNNENNNNSESYKSNYKLLENLNNDKNKPKTEDKNIKSHGEINDKNMKHITEESNLNNTNNNDIPENIDDNKSYNELDNKPEIKNESPEEITKKPVIPVIKKIPIQNNIKAPIKKIIRPNIFAQKPLIKKTENNDINNNNKELI